MTDVEGLRPLWEVAHLGSVPGVYESRLSKPWHASQLAVPLHGLHFSACLQVPATTSFHEGKDCKL